MNKTFVFLLGITIPSNALAYLGPGLGFFASTIILVIFICLLFSGYFLMVQPLVNFFRKLFLRWK